MATVSERLQSVKARIPEGVELIAVSKFHPVEALREAYDAGQRYFGESRVQELSAKVMQLPDDIHWHFIGHLQTNKVKQLVRANVDTIESVDSIRLLQLIEAEAAKAERKIKVLLQVHVAKEETKTGFLPEELINLLNSEVIDNLKWVEIVGVMGMASNTDDSSRIEADFEAIAETFRHLQQGIMSSHTSFKQISMGMSHDFPLAIKHGATMVRVGTDIFGEREY